MRISYFGPDSRQTDFQSLIISSALVKWKFSSCLSLRGAKAHYTGFFLYYLDISLAVHRSASGHS